MLKKRSILPLLVVLVLTLTACTTDDVDVPDVDVYVERIENYEDVKIKPEEAFDNYMEKYPNTMVTKVELDKNLGSYMYKVEGFDSEKEYEIKIHPGNGEVTKAGEEKYLIDDDDKEDLITKENVDKVQALVDKSLIDAGEDVKLKEWTLDVDDGIAVLEVEIDVKGSNDIEYKYNVETGNLLEKNS